MTTPLITPAFLADPTPSYHALREAGPLHFDSGFFGGAWLLTRYDDVAWALKDPRLSARRTGGWLGRGGDGASRRLAPFQQLFARALLFQDAPDHTRLRQLLMPAFRPAGLAALRDQTQALVEELLDAIGDPAQPFDLMEHLARPLPARVMARLMGVDARAGHDEDPLSFVAWSDHIAEFLGHPRPDLALAQRAQRAALAMAGLFQRALAGRRGRPPRAQEHPDLLTLLSQALDAGQVRSPQELLAQCVMLLFAGHETTRHLLCNGVHALLGQPGAWQRLRGEPALLPQAVRELLRHDSPVQYTGRRVASGFLLHGRRFERGELVIPLIGAAHRDPAAYTEPDLLRLDRREAPHLAFGQGPHVCIGAALTQLEAEVAFTALLRRFPGLRLAPPEAARPASQRLDNPLYRGWRRLMVVAPAAPAGVEGENAVAAPAFHPATA